MVVWAMMVLESMIANHRGRLVHADCVQSLSGREEAGRGPPLYTLYGSSSRVLLPAGWLGEVDGHHRCLGVSLLGSVFALGLDVGSKSADINTSHHQHSAVMAY